MPTPPTLDEVSEYITGTYSSDDIARELASEIAAQARVCRIPADLDPENPRPYPPDLAKALVRRVDRALQMNAKPLGYETGVDGGINFISANDPEIRRLERPFRKLPIR